MKKMNSILMGMKKTPLTKFGMKLLFIPCLINTVLLLSSFKQDEKLQTSITSFSKSSCIPNITDPWVQTTWSIVFEDLDGTQYQDFWVEFFEDETFSNWVTVYGITLNYKVVLTNPALTFNLSQYLNGSSVFLLEDNSIYREPTSLGYRYYDYYLSPGTGYTF